VFELKRIIKTSKSHFSRARISNSTLLAMTLTKTNYKSRKLKDRFFICQKVREHQLKINQMASMKIMKLNHET